MGIDPDSSMKRGVFLDRDGVLNRNVWNPLTGAYESPLTPQQFELLPKVIRALELLKERGYLLFLVSNQPNYAKGKATMQMLKAIHDRLETALMEASVSFAAYYYCFHHPVFTGPCICRKPSPYFLKKGRETFGVDLTHSWMIGDRVTDIECGRAAGTRTVLIDGQSESKATADLIFPDLWTAAERIVSDSGR